MSGPSLLYSPQVAQPFSAIGYQEFPPCAALRPYVRCYWQFPHALTAPWLVVPDTCADVILPLHGAGRAVFCGPDDAPTWARQSSCFGIRFYAWTVTAFASDSLRCLRNSRVDAEALFPSISRELLPPLSRADNAPERVMLAEAWLLEHLKPERIPGTLHFAVREMLLCHGNARMAALGSGVHLSSRQLERQFQDAVGLSPKRLCDLIRYQSLWQAALSPRFQVQNEVARLGFADQSHLLRDFRRYHGMSLGQARLHAETCRISSMQTPSGAID